MTAFGKIRSAPTIYNGSARCVSCRRRMGPNETLYGDECYRCKNRRVLDHLQGLTPK